MPSSYRAPIRKDFMSKKTMSQTEKTNLSAEIATVQDLVEKKGRDIFSIRPQDTIGEAVNVLADKRIGAVVVTDATGALQGILSERDIVRKLAETPGQTLPQKVEDIMTRNVATCSSEEPLVTVLRRMTKGRFRHMPVMDNEKLAGMITIGDVVNFRLNELEHEALQLKQMIIG